jgi:hypothetical protein
MFGIVLLAVVAGYFGLALLVTTATLRFARNAGAPPKARRALAGIILFAFYLVPFWDLIPTLVSYHHHCRKDAKFEGHKHFEQWQKENPASSPDLRYQPSPPTTLGNKTFLFNGRITDEYITRNVFLSVKRVDGRLIDTKNGEVLAAFTDFRAGYPPLAVGGPGSWKFWLKREACGGRGRTPRDVYSAYVSKYELGGGTRLNSGAGNP